MEAARASVKRYFTALRTVRDLYPESRRRLVRCAECGIHFFTDVRNAGRTDLRCPFGCRRERRRQLGAMRSFRHYRRKHGRELKTALNGKRRRAARQPIALEAPPEPPRRPEDLGPDMIAYIQLLTGIIERRAVSRAEAMALIAWVLRQRSFGERRRTGYGAPQTRRKSRGG